MSGSWAPATVKNASVGELKIYKYVSLIGSGLSVIQFETAAKSVKEFRNEGINSLSKVVDLSQIFGLWLNIDPSTVR